MKAVTEFPTVPSFCVSFRFILFMQSKFSIQSSAIRIDLSERESLSGKTVADRIRQTEREKREREREREGGSKSMDAAEMGQEIAQQQHSSPL